MTFPQQQSLCLVLMCLSVSQKDVQTTVMFLILWFSCEVWNAMMDFFFFAKTQQRSSVPRPRKHGTRANWWIIRGNSPCLHLFVQTCCCSVFRNSQSWDQHSFCPCLPSESQCSRAKLWVESLRLMRSSRRTKGTKEHLNRIHVLCWCLAFASFILNAWASNVRLVKSIIMWFMDS